MISFVEFFESNEECDEAKQINLIEIKTLLITAEQVRKSTRSDPVLSRVVECIMTGWPQKVDPEFSAYFQRRQQITTEEGCL